ncbi:hypothetical protein K493DRAFT_301435 [Basidiobolus meristosporus CBS 931.73]|uniref:Uncharacterized protein n=1 Tax=Basidiobolus meristosporus CBS 931.73 TaxID=1314790 RepID=A0A1Y1YC01_9FUNG|nr:hypothetical protein K493DRAFT_301435 [Basidiobolus meristosporus CBS 931.73]|eukprot:ORX95527.1 hypothetical protein K493DRAFT_301435 [Basidiobolus meristosporus CBS 931.73]
MASTATLCHHLFGSSVHIAPAPSENTAKYSSVRWCECAVWVAGPLSSPCKPTAYTLLPSVLGYCNLALLVFGMPVLMGYFTPLSAKQTQSRGFDLFSTVINGIGSGLDPVSA